MAQEEKESLDEVEEIANEGELLIPRGKRSAQRGLTLKTRKQSPLFLNLFPTSLGKATKESKTFEHFLNFSELSLKVSYHTLKSFLRMEIYCPN